MFQDKFCDNLEKWSFGSLEGDRLPEANALFIVPLDVLTRFMRSVIKAAQKIFA